MLEQSGIGTVDGMVIVDLRESGEIVVRASAPTSSRAYQMSPALAAIREYAKHLPPNALTLQEQIDAWDDAIAQGIADHFVQSMKDSEDGE